MIKHPVLHLTIRPSPSAPARYYAVKLTFARFWKNSARAGGPSFWQDPSLEPDTWNTALRPAIVLQVEIDKWIRLWTVKVMCIGRGTLTSADANMISISFSPTSDSVTPSPAWPQKFFCYPGEVLIVPFCLQTETS